MGKVAIVTGNEEELKQIEEAKEILEKFNIEYHIKTFPSMENLNSTIEFAENAEKEGFDVIIVCTGYSTYLPGVIASKTILPVIGVAIPNNEIKSVDAISSMVQMPEGVPVGIMSFGKAGVKNAAIFAAEIISRKEEKVKEKLKKFKEDYI